MAKNIVLCLDGTGNQIKADLSNVLKLYRTLERNNTDEQVVYYDTGVGTLGRQYTWGRFAQKIRNGWHQLTGIGVDTNVVEAYRFIIENYAEGDKIFLFGYSRGAHTARVLAGLLYEIGILRPFQINQADAALDAYKQTLPEDARRTKTDKSKRTAAAAQKELEKEDTGGQNFRRLMQPLNASIEFIGLWDTVSTVFVPNYGKWWPPVAKEHLVHSDINPAVKAVRHAVAIDEHRKFFPVEHWQYDEEYRPNIYSTNARVGQSVKTVWFAGYHGDIGGGSPRGEGGAAQYTFIWMINEAKDYALKFRTQMVNYVTAQRTPGNASYTYPEAVPTAPLHVPRPNFPKGSRRAIPEDAEIYPAKSSSPPKKNSIMAVHDSVLERIKIDKSYRPDNLPEAIKNKLRNEGVDWS